MICCDSSKPCDGAGGLQCSVGRVLQTAGNAPARTSDSAGGWTHSSAAVTVPVSALISCQFNHEVCAMFPRLIVLLNVHSSHSPGKLENFIGQRKVGKFNGKLGENFKVIAVDFLCVFFMFCYGLIM